MLKISTLLILTLFISNINGAEINYEVSMPNPHTHYFEVKINVTDYEKEHFDIQMPVWAPGSYLVREFSKNVEGLSATSNTEMVKTKQLNKNTWRIFSGNKKNVTISYLVYAYEMSVRTSFIDASHGYFNGTSMFMFIDELKNDKSTLTIHPYKEWKKVSTSLTKVSDNEFKYEAANYDILVDSPVEIGNHKTFDFTSDNVVHHVAMYGEGNYNIEQLKVDMAKITHAATEVFGENPNKEYTFIIHNLTVGSGGLEHLNSTTLQVNRWTYGEDGYKGFLSLVAHEYFHLWNVKRIRPIALGPFDYNNENYTDLLWVMEGFTSYYDELLLYRAGFYTEEEIIRKLSGSISSIENQPGNKVQPVADASFNAWIKAYRPNENSYNTTISYYTKGSVVANMLDLMIINSTKGKKSLDNVMQYLYNEYYKKENRGFTIKEMQKTLETISGLELSDFFNNYIFDVKSFDYPTIFGYAGYKLETNTNTNPSLGISSSGNFIKRVIRNGSAYEGGLNVNDEIISIDGYRVKNNISELISDKKVGDKVAITISRDNIIQTLDIVLKERGNTYYRLFQNSKEPNNVCKKWLQKI